MNEMTLTYKLAAVTLFQDSTTPTCQGSRCPLQASNAC